jgi:hypothetical protein
MRDRHDDDTWPISQNLLAEMLGVHRPTITHAVKALQGSASFGAPGSALPFSIGIP